MAINKKLIHFNNFSNFNSKKLSANVENTKYTIGIEGSIQNGEPEILYQSIVYIKDVQQQWTHGQIYDCSETGFIPGEGEGSVIQKDSENRGCEAIGDYSLAGGVHAKATGLGSLAFGRYVSASGRAAMALGGAIGSHYITGGANSLIYTTDISNNFVGLLEGLSLLSSDNTLGNNSIQAIIQKTEIGDSGLTITLDKTFSKEPVANLKVYLKCVNATGISSFAEGASIAAIGDNSHAEGNFTIAKGKYSHAEGQGSNTTGQASHAEGYYTKAKGVCSHAEGKNTATLGQASHAEGTFSIAEGVSSHAEGYHTKAKGYASHAEGGGPANIYLTGNNKIYTISKGTNFQNTFYLLQNILNIDIMDDTGTTIAKIVNVNIEDGYTITIELDTNLGELSHKLFYIPINIAMQNFSHTENFGSSYGEASHAGGWSSAKGDTSFSHGYQSVASGKTSAVFGTNNYSQNNSEFSLGRSNRSHNGETDADKTLFSVGCGAFNEIGMDTRIANKIPLPTPEDGTNALEIMQNGDIWLGTYNEGHKIWDNINKRVCNAWSILDTDPFNGHAYVDLGLPSGTLWASTPLTSSEGEALYFQWGDTEGWTAEQVQNDEKAFAYDGSDYKWNEGEFQCDGSSMTKYNATDGKVILDLEDDAAHVHMGGDWHMPTKEQLEELKANTTSTWTTKDGINGRLFTSKVNGNSVFVPAFGGIDDGYVRNVGSYGCVWSSSVGDEGLRYAWGLYFSSSYLGVGYDARSNGQVVFGVVG